MRMECRVALRHAIHCRHHLAFRRHSVVSSAHASQNPTVAKQSTHAEAPILGAMQYLPLRYCVVLRYYQSRRQSGPRFRFCPPSANRLSDQSLTPSTPRCTLQYKNNVHPIAPRGACGRATGAGWDFVKRPSARKSSPSARYRCKRASNKDERKEWEDATAQKGVYLGLLSDCCNSPPRLSAMRQPELCLRRSGADALRLFRAHARRSKVGPMAS